MKKQISERVDKLRLWMKRKGLSAYIIPSTDAHMSEYVSEHWESRKWITGFSGSAGTAVVTLSRAALWTDSRYFLAAQAELADTPFELMKEGIAGTPTIGEWLLSMLKKGETAGLDGEICTHSFVEQLTKELGEKEIFLRSSDEPITELWEDRPSIPNGKVTVQLLEYALYTCREKVEMLREELRKNDCEAMVVSALDEIAWLLNLRGTDVHCTPVFVAFLIVTLEKVSIYIDEGKISDDVADYLKGENVEIFPYEKLYSDISEINHHILLTEKTNDKIFRSCANNWKKTDISPINFMKAVKNEAEIKGFRNAMQRDGVALVRFLKWLKPAIRGTSQTELSIAKKLSELRSEQSLYCSESFDTISAYRAHGAIVHYEPTDETDAPLEADGLLLLDSGAQYEDGTTDITRTICLGGEPTEEQKRDYTLVLKGHIMLSKCKFPEGTTGTQLDLAARYAMWQEGINYGHGTGHGVGSRLCVHEGPHQIRMNYMPAPIKEGMTVTDEPGIYIKDKYGIRIENTLLTVPFKETDFGKFLGFEPLTLCPIETLLIDRKMLSTDEVAWINDYHFEVRTKLIPLLEADERKWLEEATRPIL